MNVGILVLDVLAGVIGVVIDATTCGWYKLTPENVNVTLEKNEGADMGNNMPDHVTLNIKRRSIDENEYELAITSSIPGAKVLILSGEDY